MWIFILLISLESPELQADQINLWQHLPNLPTRGGMNVTGSKKTISGWFVGDFLQDLFSVCGT